jgi:glutathione S-transferase
MKLYGITGSRALRSIWALEEVGAEYELVQTHFMGDSKKPEYLALNPNGRIPTLVDGDLTLYESMAINLYLARKYGGDLWPSAENDRALAVQWSFWGISDIEPRLMAILINRMMLPEDQRDGAAADKAEKEIARPLRVLEAHLSSHGVSSHGGDHPSILGGDFTIADLNVASVLAMSSLVGLDLAPWPTVQQWLASCTSRPSMVRAQQAN